MPKDNQQEKFYLVDKDDQVLGSITRDQAHSDKTKIHRCVQIVITNHLDQILLQKRSMSKDTYPGYWTLSAAGHVEYGQTYLQAAKRELFEEVGIKTRLTFIIKYLLEMPSETEIEALYTGKVTKLDTTLDAHEISQVKWVKKKDLQNFVTTQKITTPAIKAFKVLGLLKELDI